MKKLNKFFAALVALAMMATLCVSMAFASPKDPDETKNEIAASEAYLTKYLKIDEGVTVPNATFTITFAADELPTDSTMNSTTVKKSEVVVPEAVSFSATDMWASASTKDNGALVWNKLLFGDKEAEPKTEGIFDNVTFPHYGEYVYIVTETITPEDPAKGTFTENNQEYTLHIYYSADGMTVTVEGEEENPDYNPEDEDSEPTKPAKKDAGVKDPSDPKDTPNDPSDDKNETDIDQVNVEGFSFVNEYKLDEQYKPTGYGAFYAEKAVTGDYGDTKTAEFPFTITVDFGTYNGDKALDIVDASGTKIGELNATTGSALVWLKHGDIAAFKNLPDGAKVTVTEDLTTTDAAAKATNVDWYAQTAKSFENGNPKGDDVVIADKTDASHAASTVTANQVEYKDAYAKAKNAVEITNKSTYQPSTTGILVANLPYIVLALVAIGGMVAYVVVRRRQSDEA